MAKKSKNAVFAHAAEVVIPEGVAAGDSSEVIENLLQDLQREEAGES
jgi:hypothetical protein